MITAFYAALLGLFFTVLTLRVLALRGVTPEMAGLQQFWSASARPFRAGAWQLY